MTRAQKAVRLLTQIREEDPALWQQILEFQFRRSPEEFEKWEASEQDKFIQSITERRAEKDRQSKKAA